jgi:hypothetical protein
VEFGRGSSFIIFIYSCSKWFNKMINKGIACNHLRGLGPQSDTNDQVVNL